MNPDLNSQIQALVEFVRDLAPEVRVEQANMVYEDEHANLKVYPPLTWDEDQCLTLQHRIAEQVMDDHVDSGFLILVYVYTPEQQIEQARQRRDRAEQELVLAQRRHAEADRVLREAAALGMLDSTAG